MAAKRKVYFSETYVRHLWVGKGALLNAEKGQATRTWGPTLLAIYLLTYQNDEGGNLTDEILQSYTCTHRYSMHICVCVCVSSLLNWHGGVYMLFSVCFDVLRVSAKLLPVEVGWSLVRSSKSDSVALSIRDRIGFRSTFQVKSGGSSYFGRVGSRSP